MMQRQMRANRMYLDCILGFLRRAYGYHVEYGSRTADGGCLPAAD